MTFEDPDGYRVVLQLMSLATDKAFQIRLAEARDAEAMTSLENSAGALSREIPALAWLADGEDLAAERYRDLIAGGASWVIAGADDRPVAFLSASREANAIISGRSGYAAICNNGGSAAAFACTR